RRTEVVAGILDKSVVRVTQDVEPDSLVGERLDLLARSYDGLLAEQCMTHRPFQARRSELVERDIVRNASRQRAYITISRVRRQDDDRPVTGVDDTRCQLCRAPVGDEVEVVLIAAHDLDRPTGVIDPVTRIAVTQNLVQEV